MLVLPTVTSGFEGYTYYLGPSGSAVLDPVLDLLCWKPLHLCLKQWVFFMSVGSLGMTCLHTSSQIHGTQRILIKWVKQKHQLSEKNGEPQEVTCRSYLREQSS